MFVPVTCEQCGKSFQIPEANLGRTTVCPWCQAIVTTAPVTVHEPATPPIPVSVSVPASAVANLRPRQLLKFLLWGLLCLLIGAASFAASRFGSGVIPHDAWQAFTPPGGDCRVELPGTPDARALPANPFSPVMESGQEYVVHRWFDRVTVSVGWIDLARERLALTRPDDLLAAAMRFRVEQHGARLLAQSTVRFNEWTGIQAIFEDSEGMTIVERYYIVAGNRPRPRMYVLSAIGTRMTPESPVVQRLFHSFTLLVPE